MKKNYRVITALLVIMLLISACTSVKETVTQKCTVSYSLVLKNGANEIIASKSLGQVQLTSGEILAGELNTYRNDFQKWIDASNKDVDTINKAIQEKMPVVKFWLLMQARDEYKVMRDYDAKAFMYMMTRNNIDDIKQDANGCTASRDLVLTYLQNISGVPYAGFYGEVALYGPNLSVIMHSPEKGQISVYVPRQWFDAVATAVLNGQPIPENVNGKIDFSNPEMPQTDAWYESLQKSAADEAGTFSFLTTDVAGRKELLPILAQGLQLYSATLPGKTYKVMWTGEQLNGQKTYGSFVSHGSSHVKGSFFLLFGGISGAGHTSASGNEESSPVQVQTGQLFYVPVE